MIYNSFISRLENNAKDGMAVLKHRRIGKKAIDKNSKLYKVSVEFEAIFIKQMLNEMRKTVEKSGLIKRGMAEDIFEDMLYDEYAKKMAENEDFGLARILYKQLSGDR